MPVTKVNGKQGISYRVRIELPRDPVTGARRWTSEMVRGTKREAEARERVLRVEADRGDGLVVSDLTLEQFFAQYRRSTTAIRDNTWYRNGQDIRLRILPALGHARIADLRPVHIQSFVDVMEDDFAAATIRRAYATLHTALGQAVAWQMLPANPCVGVRLPRVSGEEMRFWDRAQVGKFLAVVRDCPYRALWLLAVLVGMRKGELLALQWGDIDFDHRTLRVNRTLTRDRDLNVVTGPPKTRAGLRTITLPALCLTSLVAHQRLHLPVEPTHLVFVREHGLMLSHNAPNALLARYADEARVPRIRFHDLRHTAATLALLQGVSPRVVQERMGHASLAITLGLYSHVTPTMQEEAADKMDQMFGDDEG